MGLPHRRSPAAGRAASALRGEPAADRRDLQSGAIGDVRALSIERAAPLDERVPWRDVDPQQGGSVLYDVGIHLLDLVPSRRLGHRLGRGAGEPGASIESAGRDDDDADPPRQRRAGQRADFARGADHRERDLVVVGTAGAAPHRAAALGRHPPHRGDHRGGQFEEEEIPAGDSYRAEPRRLRRRSRRWRHAALATGEEALRLVAITQAVERAAR